MRCQHFFPQLPPLSLASWQLFITFICVVTYSHFTWFNLSTTYVACLFCETKLKKVA
jgi:hypothetical protein